MKYIYWVLFVLSTSGCASSITNSTDAEEKFKKLAVEEIKNSTIDSYLDKKYTIELKNISNVNGYKFNDFDIKVSAKEGFNSLDNEKKAELLDEVTENMSDFIDCGEKIECSLNEFKVSTENHSYVLDTTQGSPDSYKFDGEIYDPYAPTEEQQKINEIYSNLTFVVKNISGLSDYGYPPEYTISSKHGLDITYSLLGAQESAEILLNLIEQTDEASLINSAKHLEQTIKGMDALKGQEYNQQLVDSFLSDIEAIMTVYAPSELEKDDDGVRGQPGLSYYYHNLKN